ncbi:ABC transporter substrate-binding protein [Streptomyces afghaniensis]|uniref:ABC transporter substrate-binding protein n=1 Tax=Streptomyces afghaniensis TaxID=66865 RepID=UPI00358DEE00
MTGLPCARPPAVSFRRLPSLRYWPAVSSPVEKDFGSEPEGGSAGRLRVALAIPPVQALSPYSDDATLLGKLAVVEGLTALDKNGAAAPALAKSWKQNGPTTWTFELRKATFQDGTPVTADSVVNALDHADAAMPKPRVLSRDPHREGRRRRHGHHQHQGRRPGAPAAPGQPGASRRSPPGPARPVGARSSAASPPGPRC